MREGLAAVWPYVDELFQAHAVEAASRRPASGWTPPSLREEFDAVIAEVLTAAAVPATGPADRRRSAGRRGPAGPGPPRTGPCGLRCGGG